MKKALYTLSFWLLMAMFLLNSCKKTVIDTVDTTETKDTLTYQPVSAGSQWTYNLSVNGIPYQTYKSTSLEFDSTFNGRTYHVFDSEVDGRQYTRKNGNKYYTVLTSSTNYTEICLLDADKNVNETWIGGVNGSDTYEYTMLEKHPSFVLDNFTFKDVLVVKQEKKDGGGNITLSSTNYYALGIGMIQSYGTLGSLPLATKLTSVTIK